MCLAIPAKIAELDEDGLATVDILGVTREISVDLTPQAQVGDYVLVHAGFAIEVVDEQFAQETIDLIKQFPELVSEDLEAVATASGAQVEMSGSMGSESSPGPMSAAGLAALASLAD